MPYPLDPTFVNRVRSLPIAVMDFPLGVDGESDMDWLPLRTLMTEAALLGRVTMHLDNLCGVIYGERFGPFAYRYNPTILGMVDAGEFVDTEHRHLPLYEKLTDTELMMLATQALNLTVKFNYTTHTASMKDLHLPQRLPLLEPFQVLRLPTQSELIMYHISNALEFPFRHETVISFARPVLTPPPVSFVST